jgi:hypothetical protein
VKNTPEEMPDLIFLREGKNHEEVTGISIVIVFARFRRIVRRGEGE